MHSDEIHKYSYNSYQHQFLTRLLSLQSSHNENIKIQVICTESHNQAMVFAISYYIISLGASIELSIINLAAVDKPNVYLT